MRWAMPTRPATRPVTVTGCGTAQLLRVKRSAPDTVATAGSELTGVSVTVPVGRLRSATV